MFPELTAGPSSALSAPAGFVPPAMESLAPAPVRPMLPSLSAGRTPELTRTGPDTPQARLQHAMSLIIPALAMAAAGRQGGLGSLANGYLTGVQARERMEAQDASLAQDRNEFALRRQDYERRAADSEASRAEAAAQAAAAAQKARETGIVSAINAALEPMRENGLYADGVTPEMAQSATLNVPGIGPISMADAFQRVGVAQVDGKYIISKKPKPASKTTRQRASLADGEYDIRYDENGTEVGRTRIGTQYRAPERPQTPDAPKPATVKVKAQGRPFDRATVLRVMRNPQAMQALLADDGN